MTLKMFAIGFVDNKLSIHFGEDKTELIFFASQCKIKNIKKLNLNDQSERLDLSQKKT